MSEESYTRNRSKKAKKPLNSAQLRDLALAYVARYATSRAKLSAYLHRKLRERGWEGAGEPDISGLVERYAELGYIDDEAFARAKGEGLLRRGYGRRRVEQALFAAGIEEDLREAAAPDPLAERRAALAMAKKRRFGPFGMEPPDVQKREKQIAAMIRAGHGFDAACALIDASSIEQAMEWVDELAEDDDENSG